MKITGSFGIVGCGKMGQALASRMVPGLECPVYGCDVLESAREDMRKILGDRAVLTPNLEEISARCNIILLAVKPVHALSALKILGAHDNPEKKTILSIVAGLTHEKLCEASNHQNCVRIMPNTPALMGAGSMVVFDSHLDAETRSLVEGLFSKAGTCHFVERESMMDAVTGLSGSTPALFAMLAEALSDAAVAEGLPRALSLQLARETMAGTAKLLEIQHPAVLKENVMSPGGTTAAGVLAAENAGFRAASQAFVAAATHKSRDLG